MDGGEGAASLADYVTPRERAAGPLWLGRSGVHRIYFVPSILHKAVYLIRGLNCAIHYQWRTQEFCSGVGGEGSTNSVEDRGQREKGSGDGSPLVRGSGGSCNLVQEISLL